MRIIGIDPGYERLGVALLEKLPGKKEVILFSACLITQKADLFEDRLHELGVQIEKLIADYSPQALAIENLFLSNNQKTAMRVAEVRGMLLYVAKKHSLSIHEYTPLQVKTAVAGYGKADKKQVEQMIGHLVQLPATPKYDDEYDAIAVALTGAASIRFPK